MHNQEADCSKTDIHRTHSGMTRRRLLQMGMVDGAFMLGSMAFPAVITPVTGAERTTMHRMLESGVISG